MCLPSEVVHHGALGSRHVELKFVRKRYVLLHLYCSRTSKRKPLQLNYKHSRSLHAAVREKSWGGKRGIIATKTPTNCCDLWAETPPRLRTGPVAPNFFTTFLAGVLHINENIRSPAYNTLNARQHATAPPDPRLPCSSILYQGRRPLSPPPFIAITNDQSMRVHPLFSFWH